MFKLIGGIVVYGFALYGLSKYLERPAGGDDFRSVDAEAKRGEQSD